MLDPALKNARILIVDDQEANILVLEGLFSRLGYTHLNSLQDSRQFLAAFDEFQPDMILLDLHMPHFDGFAVMAQLKERIPLDDYLPILVLTADDTKDAKLRALKSGASDFLSKPLDLVEVTLRVKNLLETRYLHQQIQNQNALLEEKVRERTAELYEREQDLQRSNTELALAYDETIEGWSKALESRDKETEGHTLRVCEMTLNMVRAMGLSDSELANIRRGALLHDIGKMGVPDGILLKPGPLTAEEWVIMRQHPVFAYELLAPIKYLHQALDIPYSHHEKWDGSGYPRGLKGEQIPLAARLFAVVDVWDALRSDRPYRKAWNEEPAREYIQSLAGTHFDPQAVAQFFDVLGASEKLPGAD